jgi:cell division protein FtsB
MEVALRVVISASIIVVALWIPKYVQEQPVEADLSRLGEQIYRLEQSNEEIRLENDSIRTLVRGLQNDSRVLERSARETLGLSRSDELIIWFEDREVSTASLR